MDLEEQIRQRRINQSTQMVEMLGDDNLIKAMRGRKGDEGEIRTWANGKKMKKQGGKWIEVTQGKDGKKQDDEGKSKPKDKDEPKEKSSKADDNKSPTKPNKEGSDVSKVDIAQLTMIKNLLDKDPNKAFEIFESLSPEAQSKVPQDIINSLVEQSYDESDAAADVFDEDENPDRDAEDVALEIDNWFDSYDGYPPKGRVLEVMQSARKDEIATEISKRVKADK